MIISVLKMIYLTIRNKVRDCIKLEGWVMYLFTFFIFLMKSRRQCIYLLYTNSSWHNSSAVDAICKGGFTACNSHQPHVFLFWRWLIIPLFQKLHLCEYYSQVSAEWNVNFICFRFILPFIKTGIWHSLCVHWEAAEPKA